MESELLPDTLKKQKAQLLSVHKCKKAYSGKGWRGHSPGANLLSGSSPSHRSSCWLLCFLGFPCQCPLDVMNICLLWNFAFLPVFFFLYFFHCYWLYTEWTYSFKSESTAIIQNIFLVCSPYKTFTYKNTNINLYEKQKLGIN